MIFLILLSIPILIAVLFFVFTHRTITWKEFLFHCLIQLSITTMSMGIIYTSNTGDVEIWNGKVIKKTRQEVSCEHSYQCMCFTSCSGSGENRICTQICQTCYDHSYDIDWDYYTTDSGRRHIERINRQGTKMPPRWGEIVIGEPSSSSHYFENFIKSSPDTLFRHQGLIEKYKLKLPAYPGKIYDYYRINRIVTVDYKLDNYKYYNQKLSELNANLGRPKQVNMIIVLANNLPQEYFYALEQHWLGGKKNDAILVIGLNDDNQIKWVSVMAWTIDEIFKIKLRDSIIALKFLDVDKVLHFFGENVEKYYKRKPMKDFEYLKASIIPSTTQLIVSIVIGIISSLLTGFFLHRNDIKED